MLDLNSKVQIFILCINKQSNNILNFTNYTKTKLFNSNKKMTNKNKTNKQNTKQRKKDSKNQEKIPLLLDEACWCCFKLLHLHKRVKREYQLTRQSNKAQE